MRPGVWVSLERHGKCGSCQVFWPDGFELAVDYLKHLGFGYILMPERTAIRECHNSEWHLHVEGGISGDARIEPH